MNPWYRSRSIEGEFVATWLHMRARHRSMQAHVFDDITRELDAQERVTRSSCSVLTARNPATPRVHHSNTRSGADLAS